MTRDIPYATALERSVRCAGAMHMQRLACER
jgi:hypothetical protein